MAIEHNRPAGKANTKEISMGEFFSGLAPKRRISDKDRRFFTERMALMLSTGTSLHISLQALEGQLENPSMQALVEQLIEDVGEGKQFSQALAKHPDVFSQTYINLIGASEEGGFMHEVLEQLLEMEEKREKLQRTMFSALSYPVFLLLFALGVVVFVLVVVFPKFADMFSSIQDQLPGTTLFLMAASHLFREQWAYLLTGLALLLIGLRYWAASNNGRQWLDWSKLHLPGLRGIFVRLYLMQSMRVLSLSLSNGVGILDALHASRDVVRNRLFHQFIDGVEQRVEGGDGIAAGFKGTGFIPPMVQQMIKTGEETGSLPKVMSRLADFYEGELSARLETVSRLAEPVMLLVMGVVVGVLVSSLILPIFKLSRAVG
ncbi:MAG: type II secretion system F family protein [gamma proteobacterium endosymbiont of Lamellibrachia anaximandri]|nr:type II secretion system F family protein [gamma proteobacterium endosymbiont of Lamellibrachia anaximandri]MBL3619071.1 type II secretion system F family protein [gamma proteobacterium endosymbiont of Lamellibrachia anaximandri]